MKLANHLRNGITMTELLVVIAIVAVMAAILLPAIMAAREAARRAACKNNLKQIALALHNYHDTFNTLPIGARSQRATGTAAGYGPSWWVCNLPYIEQSALYDEFDQDMHNNGDSNSNTALSKFVMIPLMQCPSNGIADYREAVLSTIAIIPSQPARLYANYAGNAGAAPMNQALDDYDGGFEDSRVTVCCLNNTPTTAGKISAGGVLVPNRSVKFSDVTDGQSNVLMVTELNGIMRDTFNKVDREF